MKKAKLLEKAFSKVMSVDFYSEKFQKYLEDSTPNFTP